MNWQDFHFIRPGWLLLFIPMLLLVARLWIQKGNDVAWRRVVSPELLPHLLLHEESRVSSWWLILPALGFSLGILAVAGPAWERLPQPVFAKTSPLVIAMDLSSSMNARDMKPSRLQQARFKVEDILNKRREGQTALIVFAGAAFTVSPLTDDARTIIAQLPALTPDIMPVQGSNTAAAIDLAVELLQQANQPRGKILLVTDGVNPAASVESANKAEKKGYQVSVLATGTEAGAPIPTRHGVIKDKQGNIVIPRVDFQALENVAQAGQGRMVRLSLDDADIQALKLEAEGERMTDASQASDQQVSRWKDMGAVLLLMVLPLAALAFRRGILLIVAVMVVPFPNSAEAGIWADLWATPDQQASRLLQAEQPEQAAKIFEDPRWKASALYRAGKYDEAKEIWEQRDDAQSLYNLGNALAQEKKYKQAMVAYDKALEKDASLEDAAANRDLVKKLLQQGKNKQNNQQQNQKSGKDDQSKQDQQSGKDGQSKQDQQQSQSGEKEQQSQQDSSSKNSREEGDSSRQKPQQSSGQDASDEQQDSRDASAAGEPEDDQTDQTDKASRKGDENEQQQKSQARAEAEAARAEEEKQAEESRRMQMKEKQLTPGESQEASEQEAVSAASDELPPMDEQALSREQWLNRIPDDPGGLLKRKFKYYYKRKQYDVPQQQPW
jgi:Ca-activated chloride channel family protein